MSAKLTCSLISKSKTKNAQDIPILYKVDLIITRCLDGSFRTLKRCTHARGLKYSIYTIFFYYRGVKYDHAPNRLK
jgi:hypothetical protein